MFNERLKQCLHYNACTPYVYYSVNAALLSRRADETMSEAVELCCATANKDRLIDMIILTPTLTKSIVDLLPSRPPPTNTNYSVSRKKTDQNVFSNIFYRTLAIPMKFGIPFTEKIFCHDHYAFSTSSEYSLHYFVKLRCKNCIVELTEN